MKDIDALRIAERDRRMEADPRRACAQTPQGADDARRRGCMPANRANRGSELARLAANLPVLFCRVAVLDDGAVVTTCAPEEAGRARARKYALPAHGETLRIAESADPSMLAAWNQAVRAAAAEGLVLAFDLPVEPAPGEPQWLHLLAHPARDETGRVVHFDGIAFDVTRRKCAERAVAQANTALEARVDEQKAAVRKASRRLVRSEQRLHDYLASSSDWLWETDADGRYAYVSRAFYETSGFRPEDIIGKVRTAIIEEYFHGSAKTDRAAWHRHLADLAAHRPFRDLTIALRSANGSERWVVTNGKPLYDAGGAFVGYRGTAVDVTERVSAQQGLQASEARNTVIVDNMAESVVISDESGRIVSINRAAEVLFGYREDELVGRNVRVLMPEPFRSAHDRYLETYHRTGRSKILGIGAREVLAEKKDGTVVPIELNLSEYRDGARRRFVGSVRDVSDRLQRENALRRSEARFRNIFEQSTVGMAEMSVDGRFLKANPAICEMLGCREEDLIGGSFERVVHPADLPMTRAHVAGVLAHREVPSYQERRCRRADGDIVWGLVSLSLLYGEDGEASGYLVQVQDVTDRKRSTEALRRALVAEMAANEAKQDFLARMSHELRTPLNAILGFSKLLEMEMLGPLGDARYRQYVRDISSSGRHLLDLVNDVLDVARIEAGTFEISLTDIDAHAAVHEVVPLFEAIADPKGAAIGVVCEEDAPTLRADRRAVRQILTNLLSNAVKFTPCDGRITVRVGGTAAGGVRIAVADTGRGVPAAELDKVLTPFAQFGNVEIRDEKGIGLGLPIVKSLMDLHGGQIEIQSRVGDGTCVTVEFPPGPAASLPSVRDAAIGCHWVGLT